MAATGQAGGAAGGEGAAQGQAQGEGQAQGAPGQDVSQLADLLGQQGQSLEEMRSFLASNPWAPQQQGEGEGDQGGEIDLSFLDDPALAPEALQQQMTQTIGGLVDQRAQALVAPVQQQLAEMQRAQEARDLLGEFPEMAEEATAQQVVKMAHEWASEHFPPEIAKVIAQKPATWRAVYMMGRAAESANAEQQGSGDPGAAHLESGAGAGPGQSQVDLKTMIMNGGGARGADVLNFGS